MCGVSGMLARQQWCNTVLSCAAIVMTYRHPAAAAAAAGRGVSDHTWHESRPEMLCHTMRVWCFQPDLCVSEGLHTAVLSSEW